MKRLIFLQFILLNLAFRVEAQNYYLKTYNNEDGCPTSLVVGIAEDSLGYLWVGFSNKGVYKFDGYNFTQVPGPFTQNGLIELYKNRENEILIGIGQQTYFWHNDSAQVFSRFNDMLRSYSYLSDNTQLIGTEDGRLIRIKDDSIVAELKVSNGRVGQIALDSNENIWFTGRENTVGLLQNGVITNYEFGKNPSEQIWSVCVDNNNQVFASSLNEVKILKDGRFVQWPEASKLLKPFANYIYKDSKDRLWFLHLDGATLYDHGKFQYFGEDNFKGMALITVFEDNNGGFWFGTSKGLLRLQNEFCILNPFSLKAEFMIKNIFQDSKGRIWTGSIMDGLVYWESQKIVKVRLPVNTNVELYDFFEDHKGDIWVGTNDGIFIYTPSGIKHLKRGIDIPKLPVYSIVQDSNQEIWASTPLGIFRLHNESYTFFNSEQLFANPANKNNIFQLFTDHRKNLWLISDEGLLLWKENQFKKVNVPGFNFEVRKWGMIESNQGDLWIATEGSGLLCFKPNTNTIQRFDTLNGLASNNIVSIDKDLDGNIVTGSPGGINKIVLDNNGKIGQIITYNKDAGLIDDECLFKVILCDKNRNIWFGSGAGLIMFKEPTLGKLSYAIPTFIEPEKLVNSNRPMVLKYKDNNITFKLTGIYFSNPTAVRYSYFLKGFSTQWSVASQNRFVSFSNLKPGDYELSVKTSIQQESEWSGAQVFKFTVETPIWLHWWFILALAVVIVLLIAFLLGIWAKTIRMKQSKSEEQKRKMVELELKFLRGQMNPHFMFNSINSIQNLILNESIDQALNYLNDFGRLIRRVLNYSEKETVTIQEELDFLNEYLRLEKLRFKDKITIEIIIDPKLDTPFDRMPPMMVQPFVENAIKHGLLPMEKDGLLTIEFLAHNECLKIVITDNGVGREYHSRLPKMEGYQSKGTQIIEDRINILNKKAQTDKNYIVEIVDLKDNTNKALGTRVIIEVPLY